MKGSKTDMLLALVIALVAVALFVRKAKVHLDRFPAMSYGNYRSVAQTGDVILCSNASATVRIALSSAWNHVGMVVNLGGKLYVWESNVVDPETEGSMPDVLTGLLKDGTKLVLLEDKIRCYDGKMAVRRLRGGDPSSRLRALLPLVKRLKNHRFEQGPMWIYQWMHFFGVIPVNLGRKVVGHHTDGKIFCSELVMMGLQALGAGKRTVEPRAVLPPDFVEGSVLLEAGWSFLDAFELAP
jgi:hypothetical protein